MSLPPAAAVRRLVAGSRRRLTVQLFLEVLAACWLGALALAALWFVIEKPYLFADPPAWQRWAVAGGLVLATTMLAIGIAWRRAPTQQSAAWELDHRFGLKQRVTTSVHLSPEQLETPAGMALLADVERHVAKIDLGSRFGIGWPRTGKWLPVAGGLLAAVAIFYEPPTGQAVAGPEPANTVRPVNVEEIAKKTEALKKKPDEELPSSKSAELDELEKELDQIANKPLDTKEKVRERISELTAKEDQVKQLEKKMADKNRLLKEQLKQIKEKMTKASEGPADQLRDALEKGDFKEAREQVDKLQKKLKDKAADPKTSKEEQEKLKEQLQEMKDALQRLAQQKDKKEELQRLHREGKIDKETLDREMQQIEKQAADLKDLEDLAQEIGEAKKNMEQGDKEKADEQLEKAGDKLGEMEQLERDLQDIREKLQQMRDAQAEMLKGLNDERSDEDSPPGDNPVPATGRRPESDSAKTKSVDQREKATFDTKGRVTLGGYAPGRNFTKKPTKEIEADIKRAAQEAPEAIERQNIPKDARDMTRGYFRNLGGQK